MAKLLFLRLDGIEGEEPIGDSEKLIRIVSYAHSLSMQSGPMRPSAGKDAMLRRSYCQHGLFTVTKGFDKTSPKLFEACSNGVIFESAVIYLCTPDRNTLTKSHEPEPLLSIVLADAIIADFQYGFQEGWPTEVLAFQYSSIGWYTDWKNPEDGKTDKLEPVGWDGTENAAAQIDIPSNLKWGAGASLL